MTRQEKITNWAEKLTPEQAIAALVELVDYAIDAEEIGFHGVAPYWANTGDPLIEGQICFDGQS